MKKIFLLLAVVVFSQSLRAQYDTIRDVRTGQTVRYAGDFGPRQTVLLPRYPVFRKSDFRGVWVATVINLDMPISPDAASFQRNFIRIVDNLQHFGANAILFQIRPANDAFYRSKLNPASRFMTGVEGREYGSFDPLQFMIRESHRRGLEFHAWLNPYRVSPQRVNSKNEYLKTLPYSNFARKNPDLVIAARGTDGKYQLILDPGDPRTVKFFVDTVNEILYNYPVDAIHLDDYFYPYENVGNSDSRSFQQYNPGHLSLADWRRENVNTLIKNISGTIYSFNRKFGRRVQFGVSPFGIWANGKNMRGGSMTSGLESYTNLYADTRKWVRSHWIDYVAPQLYWTFGHNKAAYAALADWWRFTVRNTGVKLYIGCAQARVGTTAEWSDPNEIYNQLRYNSRFPEFKGSILFSYSRIFSPSNVLMRKSSLKLQQAWRTVK